MAEGIAPAVALINPKHPRNVGAVVRAASCYQIKQVWFSGHRVALEPHPGYRLPREERMRGYKDVALRNSDRIFDQFTPDVVPVAVELVPGSESLIWFEHPDNALYVFGPEDGSLNRSVLGQCHRFVQIPTQHCTNLGAAVYTVLYDRHAKRVRAGLDQLHEPGRLTYADDDGEG
jgi:tRNA(Leu) C34 or U34 (ribose-2'-O)-methylase TrmL